jgi:hypothetical protein
VGNLLRKILTGCRRARAREFLKKHDIFHISSSEYLKDCKFGEQNFAGGVLGRCRSGIAAKIVQIDGSCDIAAAAPLPRGYFGGMVYGEGASWHKPEVYGFIDHCDRVWCCGKIEDSIFFGGEYFYPHCIEAIFETLFFIK